MIEEIYSKEFPFWEKMTDADRSFICAHSAKKLYEKGTNLHNGSDCSGVFFVCSGSLRAYILSDDGKEITLYRLHKGEMCMLSASCVLQSITFEVIVDAEEKTECIVLSGPAFKQMTEKYPEIHIFALEAAVSRFSDVMWVMQQIIFMSMDKRLAIFLHDESVRLSSDTITLTQEQIARYIGSAREVVSRMLKYFVSEGILEVSRKDIRILDKQKLRQLTL